MQQSWETTQTNKLPKYYTKMGGISSTPNFKKKKKIRFFNQKIMFFQLYKNKKYKFEKMNGSFIADYINYHLPKAKAPYMYYILGGADFGI